MAHPVYLEKLRNECIWCIAYVIKFREYTRGEYVICCKVQLTQNDLFPTLPKIKSCTEKIICGHSQKALND